MTVRRFEHERLAALLQEAAAPAANSADFLEAVRDEEVNAKTA